MTENDRAVSEVLGFTLVFALVLSMVAFVTVVGFADLDDVREYEQVNNAERAFDVVADNIADVLLRGAPSRATELKLTEASVYTSDPITINITASDSSGTVTPLVANATYSPRPIVYEGNSNTQIVYSAGALFRVQNEGGRMVREPPLVLEDDRLFLPMAVTQTRGQQSIGGSTIRLRAVTALRSLDVFKEDTPYDDISINITSPRYELWAEYLSEKAVTGSTCTTDPSTNSVVCELTAAGDPKEVTIQVVRVNIEFVR